MTPADLVDRFVSAVSDPRIPPQAVEALLHPDYVFVEWPNAISPTGSRRDRTRVLESLACSRTLLEWGGFEVHEHVTRGDTVASRMTWRGRLARDAGPLSRATELTAHVSQHTTVREGRLWRTESFDCYEPFGAGT